MTARTTSQEQTPGTRAQATPLSSVVMSVVVRVAGTVPVRLDLHHAGTLEQQLGMSLGTVVVYLRSGITARSIAEGWAKAAVLAQSLTPALAGRRLLVAGPCSVGAMVRLAGSPGVVAALEPARPAAGGRGAVAAVLRVQVGPVMWEVCDATAYASMLRGGGATRAAAR